MVFGVWQWDDLFDIGITTEIDENEALLPNRQTKTVIIIILFVIAILFIILIFLFLWVHGRENTLLRENKRHLEKTVQERTKDLEKANSKLKEISEIDPMTGIANRRLYEYNLRKYIMNAKRAELPLSLLMIDIDYFKPFNDNYGHEQGDIALKKVAEALVTALPRETDFVARYGGEEFVALLSITNADSAYNVAERIRLQIESIAIDHRFSDASNVVTVSIGISSLSNEALNDEDLFKQADNALYQAKENGRNMSVIYK